MHDVIDLNAGSGFVYGRAASFDPAMRLNALIDAALVAADRVKPPRDYLGASRIGEPCPRKLVYEVTQTPKDDGREFEGRTLRIFEVGHQLEDLCAGWLRSAGFDVRTCNRAGEQFGFSIAGGRIRGHIDGAIVEGPDIGITWPALWEHKALGETSWSNVVRRGVRTARPVYFAQVQLYMAYMELPIALFSATNRDSLALYHEIVLFDAAEAQALSDKAVVVVRAAEVGQLPPRIAVTRRCPLGVVMPDDRRIRGARVEPLFSPSTCCNGAATPCSPNGPTSSATRLVAFAGNGPFAIDARVVLPDHLHCVWTSPAGDDARRLVALDPSEEARFVLPQIGLGHDDGATRAKSVPHGVVDGVFVRRR